MLESINLSISSACGADCIFCPSERGKSIKEKFMSFETAKKIFDEISSESFKKKHNLRTIQLGENGDAFLNKDFLRILRYLKQKLPEVNKEIYTNFQNLTSERSEIILDEGLIDTFHVNIDGYNQSNYFLAKKLDLSNTLKNLESFLTIRKEKEMQVPLSVHVLTVHNYINTIFKKFGFLPIKLKNPKLSSIPDDFKKIKKKLIKLLDPKFDRINRSAVFAWSERKNIDITKIDYSGYNCPLLNRVETEAFIAPDGLWYACCYDSNTELKLGNIHNESLDSIFNNDKRINLIRLLKEKKFKEIRGPCLTVPACQSFSDNKGPGPVTLLKRKIKKSLKLIKDNI